MTDSGSAAAAMPDSSVPPFVTKLLAMVDDPSVQSLIHWAPHGDSFYVTDADRLASDVLPTRFKHSNFTSLVRQLNMYGFRKVAATGGGAAKAKGQPQDGQVWEFMHPCAKQFQPELLANIKRKASSQKARTQLAQDETLGVEAQLSLLRAENEQLRKRLGTQQQRQQQQQQAARPAGPVKLEPAAVHDSSFADIDATAAGPYTSATAAAFPTTTTTADTVTNADADADADARAAAGEDSSGASNLGKRKRKRSSLFGFLLKTESAAASAALFNDESSSLSDGHLNGISPLPLPLGAWPPSPGGGGGSGSGGGGVFGSDDVGGLGDSGDGVMTHQPGAARIRKRSSLFAFLRKEPFTPFFSFFPAEDPDGEPMTQPMTQPATQPTIETANADRRAPRIPSTGAPPPTTVYDPSLLQQPGIAFDVLNHGNDDLSHIQGFGGEMDMSDTPHWANDDMVAAAMHDSSAPAAPMASAACTGSTGGTGGGGAVPRSCKRKYLAVRAATAASPIAFERAERKDSSQGLDAIAGVTPAMSRSSSRFATPEPELKRSRSACASPSPESSAPADPGTGVNLARFFESVAISAAVR